MLYIGDKMDNFYLHDKIKNENLKAQRQAELVDKASTIVLILLFPVLLMLFIIIGLGTKKEK